MPEDLEKSLGTIAKGGTIIFFGIIIGIVFGVVNQILLGRYLGVNNYGLFYLAYTIVTILIPFSTLDLSTALSRFLPFHFARGEKDIVKSAIRFTEILVLCLSLLISMIIYFFSEKISVEIFHNINLTLVLKYFAIGLPLFSLSGILEGVIRAFKAPKYKVAIFDLGNWIVRMITFVVFIIIGYSLFGAIISCLTALIFTIFAALYIIRKRLFPERSKYQIVPVAKQLMVFSWPITFATIVFTFSSKIDVISLGYFLNSTDIGIYMPSLIIAQYITMIASPFVYMFLPVISELFGKRKFDTIESLFKSASKWIILMVLPIYIYVLLFPKEIITMLFGADYSSGYLSLVILTTGISISIFTGFTASILIGGGYTKLNLVSEVFGTITVVSICIFLIPIYGIIGAAYGVSLSYIIKSIVSLIFVYKKTKMHAYNKSYIGIIFSGLIIFAIGVFLKMQIFPFFSAIVSAIIIGLIIVVLYLVLIWVSKCLDKNDRYIINLIIKRIRSNIKM